MPPTCSTRSSGYAPASGVPRRSSSPATLANIHAPNGRSAPSGPAVGDRNGVRRADRPARGTRRVARPVRPGPGAAARGADRGHRRLAGRAAGRRGRGRAGRGRRVRPAGTRSRQRPRPGAGPSRSPRPLPPRRPCAPSGPAGRRCPRWGTTAGRPAPRCRGDRDGPAPGRGRCRERVPAGRTRRPRPARPRPRRPAARPARRRWPRSAPRAAAPGPGRTGRATRRVPRAGRSARRTPFRSPTAGPLGADRPLGAWIFASVAGLLERLGTPLAGAYPDDLVDRRDPHLAVADLARLCRLDHHVEQVGGIRVVDEDLHPHLRDEVDVVLGAPVYLGVAALPAVALHLRDGHPLHPEFLQGDLHVVELERLDDRGDEFHASAFLAPPLLSAVASSECRGAAGENAPVKLDPSSYAVSAW